MITLVYFAAIREQLGLEREQLDIPQGVGSVAELIDWICTERGEPWTTVLSATNLLVALDQEIVEQGVALKDGVELAFFPPVTGG